MAQYAQRIDIDTQNVQASGAVFGVGGGCPPIPNVFTDLVDRRGCASNSERSITFADQESVKTVVIGASWDMYFTSKDYYYKEGDRKILLTAPGGRQKAIDSLRELILKFRSEGKTVCLLLGNPIEEGFDPHTHIPRLEMISNKNDSNYVTIDRDQITLRQPLSSLAAQAGAILIDPFPYYCTQSHCLRITQDGLPIFKDNSHFNPAWAIHNARFMDVTVGVSGS